jgi:ADP-ribose pyrophosphatase
VKPIHRTLLTRNRCTEQILTQSFQSIIEMQNHNWQLLRSEVLREFRVVRVREDTYRFLPNGDECRYVVCDSADWVLVIPITIDNDIVFVRQFRHGLASSVLEIPDGVMDPGETPIQTAQRELQEETGFEAERIEMLGPLLPNPALNTARIHIAVAHGCRQNHAPSPEPHEDIQLELRSQNDVPAMIIGGELQHALCIAAFSLLSLSQQSNTNSRNIV